MIRVGDDVYSNFVVDSRAVTVTVSTVNDSEDGMRWWHPYRDFEGDAEETAEALSQILAQFSWVEDARTAPSPSVRLLRYYAQMDALDPPERRGKKAFYGFRHLVQYVAVRWLLARGYPLPAVSEETKARSTDELLALIPSVDDKADAQTRAGLFKRGEPAGADPVRDRRERNARRRERIAEALAEIDEEHAPDGGPRNMVQLEITTWCSAYVDAEQVDTLTDSHAEILGDALTQALIDARASPGDPRKIRRR